MAKKKQEAVGLRLMKTRGGTYMSRHKGSRVQSAAVVCSNGWGFQQRHKKARRCRRVGILLLIWILIKSVLRRGRLEEETAEKVRKVLEGKAR
jgi:hypothetical protein